MSDFTFFTLSVEKGLCGNIGKLTVKHKQTGEAVMDMMLFLSANGQSVANKPLATQIVNVHFPKELFETLKQYDVGDFVRVHFERIDLSKDAEKGTLSIRIKAHQIELLRRAPEKNVQKFEHQYPIQTNMKTHH